jgi:hypothetical protein
MCSGWLKFGIICVRNALHSAYCLSLIEINDTVFEVLSTIQPDIPRLYLGPTVNIETQPSFKRELWHHSQSEVFNNYNNPVAMDINFNKLYTKYFFIIPTNAHNIYTLKSTKIYIINT